MERLCLGKLSRAFVCSICSIGWSHRTVGNILKSELFLCFSWKSSKTMPSAIKPMTFFFLSLVKQLQRILAKLHSTKHRYKSQWCQEDNWAAALLMTNNEIPGKLSRATGKKIPSLANTDECYKVSTLCAITCQHISEWIFHFRLWWHSWLSKYEFVPLGISVLHIC